MKQAHVTISGFVQGVGLRHFIKSKAQELDIMGWVRNLPNGSVESIFQGSKEKIEAMVKLCKKGPFLSEIKDVVVEWEETKEIYKDFEIL